METKGFLRSRRKLLCFCLEECFMTNLSQRTANERDSRVTGFRLNALNFNRKNSETISGFIRSNTESVLGSCTCMQIRIFSSETQPCCQTVGRTRKFSELNAASCFICCQLFWKSWAVVSTGLHPNTRRYSSCQTVNTRSRGKKNISEQLPIQVSIQYLYIFYKRLRAW